MKRLFAVILLLTVSCIPSFSQFQTPDDEGFNQVAALIKISKKAKYGASLIQKEVNFSTGKGINGQPVVTVAEKGTVEMVAMENKTYIGYLLPYNQFVRLADYDFEVFNKKNFKSQKYPPQKVSLTDESIFFDDSYGQVYGFMANESGQRCRFKYDYEYSDAKYLTRVFFHQSFPVIQYRISFKIPAWLALEITEQNFAGYKLKKEIKKEKDFNVYT